MRSIGSRSGAATVVVIGLNARVMGQIREALGTEAILPQDPLPYALGAEEALRVRPQVVIAGLDEDFAEAVRVGQSLGTSLPNTTFVAVASRSEPEQIRAAMRAGYREYVVLPGDAEQLRQAVHSAAYAAHEQDDDRGQVVAVCGSKGGSGVTTLTVNLAAELAAVYKAIAIDLDFSMGDVAAYLNLTPPGDIGDLLRKIERLDERMLKGTTAVHPTRLHVLSQPNDLDETQQVTGEDVLKVLTVCAQAYQYVVLDCGVRVDGITTIANQVADQILLVVEAEVPSVKNALRRLRLFDRLGIEADRIHLVLNKVNPRKLAVSVADIEHHLGRKVRAQLTRDDATIEKAVHTGALVRDVNRRSPFLTDLSTLVGVLTDGETPETDGRGGRRMMSWLFG